MLRNAHRRFHVALAVVIASSVVAGAESPRIPWRTSSLDWMTGTWSATRNGVTHQETWTGPDGELLLGMHKEVRGGKALSFEFLRIAEVDGQLCLFASPGGVEPTRFCAVEVAAHRVVFENPAHDFPQRILYWRSGSGELHARVEGRVKGEDVAEEWSWERAQE